MTPNQKVSIVSAWILIIALIIFFFSLSLELILKSPVFPYISYAACMILSWGFLGIILGFKQTVDHNKKIYVEVAVVFGLLYAFLINLVYYTQLTTVLHQNASADILKLLAFDAPGSLMFNLDLLGYGFMALSTLFLGLSLEHTKSLLRKLLLIHGLFAFCMIVPILPTQANDGNLGVYLLIVWSLYFMPIGVLSLQKFNH